jgi:hypothetical protein
MGADQSFADASGYQHVLILKSVIGVGISLDKPR